MNCFEFRRHLTADPRSQDADLLQHKRECPACAAFAAQQAQFEERLTEALRVNVPPELHARLILNQTIHQSRRIKTFAAAAMVVLTVTVAGGWWLQSFHSSLDQAIMAHIDEERELLETRDKVSDAKVVSLAQTVGITLQGNIGEVRHAGVCRIGRHRGGHLILAGTKGPVTVLLMPEEAVAQRKSIDGNGLRGILVPTGTGSMAIVGEPGEELDKIEQRLALALSG